LQQRFTERHSSQENPGGERGEDRSQPGTASRTDGDDPHAPLAKPDGYRVEAPPRREKQAAHDTADDGADERDHERDGESAS